ncbi:MAG: ABC transporter permease, partial [Bryobacteraceae bacterium]
ATAYAPFVDATLGGEKPRTIEGSLATCNYFDVLRVKPQLGRGFVESECTVPGSGAVVLSDSLWRSAFGGDASLVGRTIQLNRTDFTVVGIAPPGFHGSEVIASDFWAPLTMQKTLVPGRELLANDNLSWLVMVGRLKPGITMEQARADLGVIAGRIATKVANRQITLSVERASVFSVPGMRSIVLAGGTIVLAAVGLVLLIACANVANLLLARAAGRRREMAVRLALGASRWRLGRQLLAESLLLAVAGGTLGTLFAFWTSGTLVKFVMGHLPANTPTLALDVTPDFKVLGYALAMTILTGIVCGLAPAMSAARTSLTAAIKEESSARSGVGFLRRALVCGQVTVCMVLLLCAGLLIRGLIYSQTVNPGFETANVALATFDLQGNGYDDTKGTAF